MASERAERYAEIAVQEWENERKAAKANGAFTKFRERRNQNKKS